MELLRRKEAAKILNISVGTLDRYIRDGRITHYKLIGGPRFSLEQLQDFILSTERKRIDSVWLTITRPVDQ